MTFNRGVSGWVKPNPLIELLTFMSRLGRPGGVGLLALATVPFFASYRLTSEVLTIDDHQSILFYSPGLWLLAGVLGLPGLWLLITARHSSEIGALSPWRTLTSSRL